MCQVRENEGEKSWHIGIMWKGKAAYYILIRKIKMLLQDLLLINIKDIFK
jgi:hypothetical protein